VSFGAQTFSARALAMMGRRHLPEDIERVYTLLRERIRSISFDLIFAHPAQTLEEWDFDLKSALELSPDHLSVYGLTYELGTPMTELVKRGELPRVPEELEREMYLRAVSRLTSAGYEHYEVSSYSLPGHRSRHNQGYWNQDDYVGVGPGACSTIQGIRYTNVRDLDGYVRGLREEGLPPRHEEPLSAQDKLNELLLLSLRTKDGLSLSRFRELAGEDLGTYSGGGVDSLIAQGLLRLEGDALLLTQEGLCLADRVISELMA
jgi:oxygen-independent coproporphyrinogen-3 oxidase